MTKEQTKIVNKLRLLWILRAWDELKKSKYIKYLIAYFSCEHCRHYTEDEVCSLSRKQRKKRRYIDKEFSEWYLGWLRKENLLDKP